MKRLRSIASSILAIVAISATTASPVFAASTDQPYVQSDTTVNFMVEHNCTYAYKMTVHGTHANPAIAAGDGSILRTESTTHTQDKSGNDVYYFKVRAIGKAGQASGVYTTLPGQKAVRHSIIAIPFSDGTYKVGTDIPAGEYVVTPNKNDSYGYYEVDKDSTGSLESIVKNDNYGGRRYLTVSDGQYLKLQQSKMIAFKDAGRLLINNNSLAAGMYKCGFDIQPGEYQIVSTDNTLEAYMELRSGDSGNLDELISNDNFSGTKYITVRDGQYLTVERGKLILN